MLGGDTAARARVGNTEPKNIFVPDLHNDSGSYIENQL